MNIYEFSVGTPGGEQCDLGAYRGKVLLIVNTASQCGFTPQYGGLQQLYVKYRPEGFEILAFPCNQFGGQEPGNDAQIQEFCQVTQRVTFPVFAKIEVKGPQAAPLFAWLTEQLPGAVTRGIKWNFTKFLIDRTGRPLRRFGPATKPEKIARHIEAALRG